MTFRDSESISSPLTSVVDPDGETEALKDGTTSHPELRLAPGNLVGVCLFLLFVFLLRMPFVLVSQPKPQLPILTVVSAGLFACRWPGPPNRGQA